MCFTNPDILWNLRFECFKIICPVETLQFLTGALFFNTFIEALIPPISIWSILPLYFAFSLIANVSKNFNSFIFSSFTIIFGVKILISARLSLRLPLIVMLELVESLPFKSISQSVLWKLISPFTFLRGRFSYTNEFPRSLIDPFAITFSFIFKSAICRTFSPFKLRRKSALPLIFLIGGTMFCIGLSIGDVVKIVTKLLSFWFFAVTLKSKSPNKEQRPSIVAGFPLTVPVLLIK